MRNDGHLNYYYALLCVFFLSVSLTHSIFHTQFFHSVYFFVRYLSHEFSEHKAHTHIHSHSKTFPLDAYYAHMAGSHILTFFRILWTHDSIEIKNCVVFYSIILSKPLIKYSNKIIVENFAIYN